jgi:hypothetical protein
LETASSGRADRPGIFETAVVAAIEPRGVLWEANSVGFRCDEAALAVVDMMEEDAEEAVEYARAAATGLIFDVDPK